MNTEPRRVTLVLGTDKAYKVLKESGLFNGEICKINTTKCSVPLHRVQDVMDALVNCGIQVSLVAI